MIEYRGPVEAMNALDDYLYDRVESIPDVLRDKLREQTQESSKVRGMTQAVEYIYANRDGLPQSLLDWGASAAIQCEVFAFSEMNVDSRGSMMSRVMLGETVDPVPSPKPGHILEIESPPAP